MDQLTLLTSWFPNSLMAQKEPGYRIFLIRPAQQSPSQITPGHLGFSFLMLPHVPPCSLFKVSKSKIPAQNNIYIPQRLAHESQEGATLCM